MLGLVIAGAARPAKVAQPPLTSEQLASIKAQLRDAIIDEKNASSEIGVNASYTAKAKRDLEAAVEELNGAKKTLTGHNTTFTKAQAQVEHALGQARLAADRVTALSPSQAKPLVDGAVSATERALAEVNQLNLSTITAFFVLGRYTLTVNCNSGCQGIYVSEVTITSYNQSTGAFRGTGTQGPNEFTFDGTLLKGHVSWNLINTSGNPGYTAKGSGAVSGNGSWSGDGTDYDQNRPAGTFEFTFVH